jgi:hypothetical protein
VTRALLDVHYPNEVKGVLVMDKLNTHTMGSLDVASQDGGNHTTKGVDWQFATDDMRVKLRRLWPQIIS